MENEVETWKDVVGYEGHYKVNNKGVVISINFKRGGLAREMKPFMTPKGYFQLKLHFMGKRKGIMMHRIIATAFIPNPENKPCINHIDGDKKNNSISNLEWCTYSHNNKHAYRLGLNKHSDLQKQITAANNRKRCSKPILNMSNGLKYVSCAQAAKELSYSVGHICDMINGKKTNKYNLIYI